MSNTSYQKIKAAKRDLLSILDDIQDIDRVHEGKINFVEKLYSRYLNYVYKSPEYLHNTAIANSMERFSSTSVNREIALIQKEIKQEKLSELPKDLRNLWDKLGGLYDGQKLHAEGTVTITYEESWEDLDGVVGGYWPRKRWIDPRNVRRQKEHSKLKDKAKHLIEKKYGINLDSPYFSDVRYNYKVLNEKEYRPSGKAAEWTKAYVEVKYRIHAYTTVKVPQLELDVSKEELARRYIERINKKSKIIFDELKDILKEYKELKLRNSRAFIELIKDDYLEKVDLLKEYIRVL